MVTLFLFLAVAKPTIAPKPLPTPVAIVVPAEERLNQCHIELVKLAGPLFGEPQEPSPEFIAKAKECDAIAKGLVK